MPIKESIFINNPEVLSNISRREIAAREIFEGRWNACKGRVKYVSKNHLNLILEVFTMVYHMHVRIYLFIYVELMFYIRINFLYL